jgi:hypothetical protein
LPGIPLLNPAFLIQVFVFELNTPVDEIWNGLCLKLIKKMHVASFALFVHFGAAPDDYKISRLISIRPSDPANDTAKLFMIHVETPLAEVAITK